MAGLVCLPDFQETIQALLFMKTTGLYFHNLQTFILGSAMKGFDNFAVNLTSNLLFLV